MATKKDEYRYLPVLDEGYVPAKSISEFKKAQQTYRVLDPIPYTLPYSIPKRSYKSPTKPVVPSEDIYRYANRTIYRKTRARRLV